MICHHHKCVFIHIPKTAGQSIEHVFLNLVGLTWETRAPLLLRSNPQSDLGPPHLSHLKAKEYVEFRYLSQDLFDSYFKFAFVRNPWDRMVSMYKYLAYHRICDFNRFVKHEFPTDLWKNRYWFVCPQSEYVLNGHGEPITDYVGKYENLQADFAQVCRKLELPSLDVPYVNKAGTIRAETTLKREIKKVLSYPWWLYRGRGNARKKGYRDHYDDESRELVAEYYKPDIESFGYEF